MKKSIAFYFIVFLAIVAACKQKEYEYVLPSTVHEVKDSLNRVVERWGNYHTDDNDVNFREFFYYDSNNQVAREKNFFFDEDNKECIITDTAEYRDQLYFYKSANGKFILEKTIAFDAEYNDTGKFIGRKLYYIKDEINDKYLFH